MFKSRPVLWPFLSTVWDHYNHSCSKASEWLRSVQMIFVCYRVFSLMFLCFQLCKNMHPVHGVLEYMPPSLCMWKCPAPIENGTAIQSVAIPWLSQSFVFIKWVHAKRLNYPFCRIRSSIHGKPLSWHRCKSWRKFCFIGMNKQT